MALWRVLDLYKRAAKRRGQAPAKQTLWTRKKSQLKAERNGAFAAKPLCESPRNSSHGGIFWVSFLLYLPSVFGCVLFRAAFSCAVLFYCCKNHFSVLFEYDFTPWKRQKSTQNLFQPIHAFSLVCDIIKDVTTTSHFGTFRSHRCPCVCQTLVV